MGNNILESEILSILHSFLGSPLISPNHYLEVGFGQHGAG